MFVISLIDKHTLEFLTYGSEDFFDWFQYMPELILTLK